ALPLLVRHAAANGSWVAFCQPRLDTDGNGRVELTLGPRGELRGDTLGSYLWQPAAEQDPGVLLAASPGDRFVAYWKDAAVTIRDTAGNRSLDLGADVDLRFSAETLDWLRTLAFDPTGSRLVYLRRGPVTAHVVVRNLLDGTERAFDPGRGEVWRTRFDSSGEFLLIDVLADTNKNGRLDAPAPAVAAPPPCLPAGATFHAWVGRGDRPERLWLDAESGKLASAQSVVLALKKALVVREASGALDVVQAGKSKLLEPAECKGRVVFADLERSLLVIGCTPKKKTGRVALELLDLAGKKQQLGIELASVESDREASGGARLVALYPGSDTALLDLDKRDLLPLKSGDAVLATLGARALVRRGPTLVLYDADARAEQPLPGTVDKFPEVLQSGSYAFVSPLLIDVAAGRVVGSFAQRPLALSTTGLLLSSEDIKSSGALSEGPLRWFSLAPSAPGAP
ncbi:MAG TPA: hypothetical protein VGM29_02940, partial [Polyangiaceae bacterium]